MAEPQIRDASPGDGHACAALWVEFGRALAERMPASFREPSGEGLAEWFEKLIAEKSATSAHFVALDDGQIVGLATASIRPPMDPPAAALMPEQLHVRASLEDIVVAARARNRGIGAALVAHVEGWARARGAVALMLSSDPDGPTRRFYERLGMRIAAAMYHKPL